MKKLVTVEVQQNLGSISSNLDAVKASITEQIAVYKTMVVSDDTISDSKKLVAELRKQKKSLDDQRISIKNGWNAPYLEFEKEAKSVIALYDEPINIINSQLIQFEEDRKAAKRVEIKATYEELKGDLGDYLTYEAIYNSKWENASVGMKSVKDDMQLRFDQVAIEIGTIKALDSEFEEQGLDMYKLTGDLRKAIEDMAKRKKMKEEIIERERKKAEEQAKKKAEEEARLIEAQKAEEEEARLIEAQKAEEEAKKLVEATEKVEIMQKLPPIEDELEAAFDPTESEQPFVVDEKIKYVQVIITAPVNDWEYLLQVVEDNRWKWEAYDGEQDI